MAKKIYGLTQHDRDLVNETIRRMGAGKGVPSKRPTPTRRRSRTGKDRKVAADTTDETPAALIDKLANTGSYDADEHQLVYGQVVDDQDDPKDNHVRLFTAISEGGGGVAAGGLVTVLITPDIDSASWNNASSILTPSVTEVTAFVLGDDEASYELGEQIDIENHDPGESLSVNTGDRYIGLCSYNEWEHLVIHMWTCRKLVVPD